MTQFLSCSGLLRRLRRGGAWIWSTISANCGHHRSTTGSPQCHKRIIVSGGSTECAKSERRLSWAGPPKAGPAKAGAPQLSPSCPTCHQQGRADPWSKTPFYLRHFATSGEQHHKLFWQRTTQFWRLDHLPYFLNTTKVDFCRKSLRRQSSTSQLTSVSLCHEYVPFVKKSFEGLFCFISQTKSEEIPPKKTLTFQIPNWKPPCLFLYKTPTIPELLKIKA